MRRAARGGFPSGGGQRCPGVVGAALLVGCRAALGAWAVWGTGSGGWLQLRAGDGFLLVCLLGLSWFPELRWPGVLGCRCGARSRVVRCCRGMLSDVPLFVRLWGRVGAAEPGAGWRAGAAAGGAVRLWCSGRCWAGLEWSDQRAGIPVSGAGMVRSGPIRDGRPEPADFLLPAGLKT